LALLKAGKSMAAKMAMMAMTTSNSIKVNAVVRGCFIFMESAFFDNAQTVAGPAPVGKSARRAAETVGHQGTLKLPRKFNSGTTVLRGRKRGIFYTIVIILCSG
jgi:hypothetical protein